MIIFVKNYRGLNNGKYHWSIFNEKKYYIIDETFMELITVRKKDENIIKLFKEDKALLRKNKRVEII